MIILEFFYFEFIILSEFLLLQHGSTCTKCSYMKIRAVGPVISAQNYL